MYALITIRMPELAELFSTQGTRGGKPSAGGASKRPTPSTPAYKSVYPTAGNWKKPLLLEVDAYKSAGFERYPTAAQLNAAPPAKSPKQPAAKNTGRPPKDPPCTQGSSGDGRRQVVPKKTGIISAYILRYCSYQ